MDGLVAMMLRLPQDNACADDHDDDVESNSDVLPAKEGK